MRPAILLIAVSFAAGAAIGFVTRHGESPDSKRSASHDHRSATATSPARMYAGFPGQQAPTESRRIPLPKFLDAPQDNLTSRQWVLRLLLDATPDELLQSNLWQVTWGEPEMERRALKLFKTLRNPEDLDLIVELKLLHLITDPVVRDELVSWIRSESDPNQRVRFATIVSDRAQVFKDDFLPVIVDFLGEGRDPILEAVLEHGQLRSIDEKKHPELKARYLALVKAASEPSRTESVRVKALKSLEPWIDLPTARYLMDVIATDRSDRIVCAAMSSLNSFRLDEDRNFVVQMIRQLYAIATDATRSTGVRVAAATAADLIDLYGEDKILSPAEQELIERLKYLDEQE